MQLRGTHRPQELLRYRYRDTPWAGGNCRSGVGLDAAGDADDSVKRGWKSLQIRMDATTEERLAHTIVTRLNLAWDAQAGTFRRPPR